MRVEEWEKGGRESERKERGYIEDERETVRRERSGRQSENRGRDIEKRVRADKRKSGRRVRRETMRGDGETESRGV